MPERVVPNGSTLGHTGETVGNGLTEEGFKTGEFEVETSERGRWKNEPGKDSAVAKGWPESFGPPVLAFEQE